MARLYVYIPETLHNPEILDGIKYIPVNETTLKEYIKDIKSDEKNKLLIPTGTDSGPLNCAGLIEFEDYLCEPYVNKRIVIIYGNCHTTAISDYLEICTGFKREYYLYRIKPIHTITDMTYFEEPVFRYCDVFVHQSIRLENRYGEGFASERIIRKLQPDCQTVAIPNVYRLPVCFFPQYSRKREFTTRGGMNIFFRDELLDRYAEQGIGKKRAFQLYMKDETFSDEFMEKSYREFINKVRMREMDWDIKCLDYIENNYKTKQLFYDPNHPTNHFILYIVEELLSYMGIKYDPAELRDADIGTLTGFEMPILPEVKRHFGMMFPDNEDMRKDGRKVKYGKMKTEDYVSQYLACEWQNAEVRFHYRMISFFRWAGMKLYNKWEKGIAFVKERKV